MPNFVSKIPFINQFFHSTFIQSVVTMLTGNIIAQVIAFLAAPVITRLYTPEQFGIMTFIQSTAGIFAVIACFCYRFAIVLPKEEDTGHNLFVLSLLAATSTSLILLVFIFTFKDVIAEKSGLNGVEWYLLFIPVAVFIVSIRDILVYFHTRLKQFKLISVSTALTTFFTAGTKILAGIFFSASAAWLILGNIMGPLLTILFLLLPIFKIIPTIRKNVNITAIKQTAFKYYKFPKYSAPAAFTNSISQNMPVFLFSYFFSPEIVGFYGLANMILRKPVDLMSQAMSKVFLQKSAELESNGEKLYENLKKTTLGLIVIGVIPFTALTLTGKWMFVFVFGEEWAKAGLYAQVLSPWLFLAFINIPSNQIYIVKQKLRFMMYFNYTNVFCRFAAIFLGCYIFYEPFYAIFLFSFVGIVMNIFFILYAFILSKQGVLHEK